MFVTDLKDLGEVRVPVGEHGVDAVDGVLGLARGATLGFGLQYRQQDTSGSRAAQHGHSLHRAARLARRERPGGAEELTRTT